MCSDRNPLVSLDDSSLIEKKWRRNREKMETKTIFNREKVETNKEIY